MTQEWDIAHGGLVSVGKAQLGRWECVPGPGWQEQQPPGSVGRSAQCLGNVSYVPGTLECAGIVAVRSQMCPLPLEA